MITLRMKLHLWCHLVYSHTNDPVESNQKPQCLHLMTGATEERHIISCNPCLCSHTERETIIYYMHYLTQDSKQITYWTMDFVVLSNCFNTLYCAVKYAVHYRYHFQKRHTVHVHPLFMHGYMFVVDASFNV